MNIIISYFLTVIAAGADRPKLNAHKGTVDGTANNV